MPDDPTVNQLLNTRTGLMIATAKMVAHYVAAAVQAGTPADTINAVLLEVTETTSIDEVFVSDADGNIEYGSHPGLNFKFPTDPGSDTQAAPFARLFSGPCARLGAGGGPQTAPAVSGAASVQPASILASEAPVSTSGAWQAAQFTPAAAWPEAAQ